MLFSVHLDLFSLELTRRLSGTSEDEERLVQAGGCGAHCKREVHTVGGTMMLEIVAQEPVNM